MVTPYLVYKELLPCGRLAWRRMANPAFSQVTAIDVAYQLKTYTHHISKDQVCRQGFMPYETEPQTRYILDQPKHIYHDDSHNTNTHVEMNYLPPAMK